MNFIYLFIYFLVGQYLNILEEEKQIYIYIYLRANLNFFILLLILLLLLFIYFFFNLVGWGAMAPLCPGAGPSLFCHIRPNSSEFWPFIYASCSFGFMASMANIHKVG